MIRTPTGRLTLQLHPLPLLATLATLPGVVLASADDNGQLRRVEALAQQTRVSEERVLDEIMGRLGRIESTTADIRTLIEHMPVAAAPAPASAAPAAAPAAVCPKPPVIPPVETMDDETALPVGLVAGGSALVALLLGVMIGRRRRATRAPAATGSATCASADTVVSPVHASIPAEARDSLPLWRPKASPEPARNAKSPPPDARERPGAPQAPATHDVAAEKDLPEVKALPTEIDSVGGKESFDPTLELAEIMMSMGLASGAAQALEEHIRENPREALVHWLKLLDVYRRDGHRTDFEKAARELRRNFNISASDWLNVGGAAPCLEEFERVMAQVIALWPTPEACVSYLQHLLEDNRDGMRNGFPQPAAEEILLLIAVQRTIHPELASKIPAADGTPSASELTLA